MLRIDTGDVLLTRDDIKYETVLAMKLKSNCWYVAIEVREKLYKDVITVLYHSSSASHGEFVRFLEDMDKLVVNKMYYNRKL